MADGYKAGHNKGKAGAKAGKGRNPKPPLAKGVVPGSTYVSSYIDGYKEGYREGKK